MFTLFNLSLAAPQDFAMAAFYEQGRDGLISAAARDALHAGLAQMRHYCHTTACRRAALLRHFGEEPVPAAGGGCGRCDNCVRKLGGGVVERDFGDAARQLLEVRSLMGYRSENTVTTGQRAQ
jgi:superfamily II DNA helicase RecQ